MKLSVLLVTSVLAAIPLCAQASNAAGLGLDPSQQAAVGAKSSDSRSLLVDCGKRQTISATLQWEKRNSSLLPIRFSGTCQENIVIERDGVTLTGTGTSPTVVGTVDVKGAKQVNISGFLIRGVPGAPFNTAEGAINITQGGAANVENVRIEDVKVRGFQVIGSTASIKDVTIVNAQAGAFVFRSSGISLFGSITAQNSIFGMSVVYSGVFAKTADLTFNNGLFGLIVQVNGSVEHVVGHLTANDNMVGVLLAGSGVYAYGTFIEVRRNSIFGIQLDENSSMTPLIGAPGGGPALTIADNEVGISVERGSDIELTKSATITGNKVGLQADNALARLSDTVIKGNTKSDLILSFGAKAEFTGTANIVASSVQCDGTALTRGPISCGAGIEATQSGGK